eukprot:GDKH01010976.1.p1 GENE.GDKH01010976.1~~GDKH01010976.1.p1  ORF type:complete len:64 (+),score=10.88 GDKH01010976.1:142-333(+)
MATQREMLEKASKVYTKLGKLWKNYLHTGLHYGLVPGIFAFSLYANGEFTLNPLTLFQKLIIS